MYPGAFAQDMPDKPAVIMGTSGDASSPTASSTRPPTGCRTLFRSLGLQVGDHVAFCLENHPHYLALVWGAHYAGLYYTAMSSRLTTDEMAYIIEDCGARAFVTSAYKRDQAAELVGRVGGDVALYMLDGAIDGYLPLGGRPGVPARHPARRGRGCEGRDMLYSSGTTGRPKGVQFPLPDAPLGTADSLYMLAAGAVRGDRRQPCTCRPRRCTTPRPLRFCMAFHRVGATVVVMEHFDAGRGPGRSSSATG